MQSGTARSALGVLLVLLVAAGCATESDTGTGRESSPRRGMHGAAHGGRQAPEALWKAYDLNGDGKVTRAEFMAVRGVCFARYDAKGDGLLILPAIQRRFPPSQAIQVDAQFRRIDLDGDGLITRAEWDQENERLFRQLDTNHDGVLAGNELSNLTPSVLGILCADGTGPGGPSRSAP